MIVVRIELWPRGSFRHRKTLAVGTMVNVGGTRSKGDYEVRLWGAGNSRSGDLSGVYNDLAGDQSPRTSRLWRTGVVQAFPRLKKGAWALLQRALSTMGDSL